MSELLLEHPAFEVIDDDWQLMEIALLAERMHTQAEYHDFSHPLDVVVNVSHFADQYELDYPERPPLNRRPLYKAALLHDIFVDQDLDTNIFPTPEHRSAYLAGYILREMDDPDEEIEHVQDIIISTNPHYQCQDDDAKALVKGDLSNTGNSFQDYFSSFKKVYLEEQRKVLKKYGPSAVISPKAFWEKSVPFLKLYFRQDLAFG